MLLALFSTFAASKAEPLAVAVTRVHDAFLAAGLGEPLVAFGFVDPAPIAAAVQAAVGDIKQVSSVARVLKRFPALETFVKDRAPQPDGAGAVRSLSNMSASGAVEPVDFTTLVQIAGGVPKSFPFRRVHFHFSAAGFSDGPDLPHLRDPRTISTLMRAGVDIGAGHPTSPGISVQDSWWVSGRQRHMAALRIVEADAKAKKLPAPPANIASLFAACGKVRKTVQVPVAEASEQPAAPRPWLADPEYTGTAQTLLTILRAHRARLGDLAKTLPHDVPQQVENLASLSPYSPSGPRKPELDRCFKPMGYDCRGGSGTFTLHRRTADNLTVALELDVGTWSNSLSASFAVAGMIDGKGFKIAMSLPPSPRASIGLVHGVERVAQFPIGGPERWRQIVENLAALVAVLDAGFVPEIAGAAGPSPEWYQPKDVG